MCMWFYSYPPVIFLINIFYISDLFSPRSISIRLDILWAQLLLDLLNCLFRYYAYLFYMIWICAYLFYMVWICACGLGVILPLSFFNVSLFSTYFFFFFFSVWHSVMGNLWAQLLLQFYTKLFETLQVLLSWSEDVHVLLGLLSHHFLLTVLAFLTFFRSRLVSE